MSDKYLRQRGSGTIYIWTKVLSLRNDMEPFDPEKAETRIAALKKRLAEVEAQTTPISDEHRQEMEKAQESSKAIADLESALDAQEVSERRALEDFDTNQNLDASQEKRLQTEAQAEVERKDKIVQEDPQIKKIMGFKKETTIEAYLLESFGDCPEIGGMTIGQMKNFALQKRQDQLFETEEVG